MLFSVKAPDKMLYSCFILILTSSPPSSGCCYNIFLFYLILKKRQGKLGFFFFSELKPIIVSCWKTCRWSLCGKQCFVTRWACLLIVKGTDRNSFWNEIFNSVQLLSHVWLPVTPWTAARQASLSVTNSWSSLKLMSIGSVLPSSHLILCRPLLLPPSIFPSIRVFSSESALRWPKY